jgi:hypothetical protein
MIQKTEVNTPKYIRIIRQDKGCTIYLIKCSVFITYVEQKIGLHSHTHSTKNKITSKLYETKWV